LSFVHGKKLKIPNTKKDENSCVKNKVFFGESNLMELEMKVGFFGVA